MQTTPDFTQFLNDKLVSFRNTLLDLQCDVTLVNAYLPPDVLEDKQNLSQLIDYMDRYAMFGEYQLAVLIVSYLQGNTQHANLNNLCEYIRFTKELKSLPIW